MSLEKTLKPKTLAFKATDEFHREVFKFCEVRNWNMSKFLEIAVVESMQRVVTREKKRGE